MYEIILYSSLVLGFVGINVVLAMGLCSRFFTQRKKEQDIIDNYRRFAENVLSDIVTNEDDRREIKILTDELFSSPDFIKMIKSKDLDVNRVVTMTRQILEKTD